MSESLLQLNRSVTQPVRPDAVLSRLRLTAGKAAELCGITRRQLCYWTDKGIIPCCSSSEGRDPTRRIYDFGGVCKTMMLKRLMDEGRGLRRAVRELRARWRESPPTSDEDAAPAHEHSLLSQAERLARLGDKARELSAARERRETLVRLAIALQPLAALSRAACEGRVALSDAAAANELKTLLSAAERAARQ